MKKSLILVAVLALLAVLVPGCAPEGAPTPAAEGGIIEIRVTDPPPADVISVDVTLANIEVHREGGGWETIDLGGEVTFDLMKVLDGVTEVLGSAGVTAGSFTGIRLDVTKVVVKIDGYPDPISAEVPSGKLKIVRPFKVEGGVKTVLTLDFDGEKSLILPGKDIDTGIERALFKPVVKLLIEKDDGDDGDGDVDDGDDDGDDGDGDVDDGDGDVDDGDDDGDDGDGDVDDGGGDGDDGDEKEHEGEEEKALEAIEETEEELAEILARVELEGITLPIDAFAGFNALLAEAKSAFATGNYEEVERLVEEAEEALSGIAEMIDSLEGEEEEEEEE